MDVTITNNADKFRDELPKRIEQALIAIGMAGESNAKKEVTRAVYDTPERGYKRTGLLRNKITHQVLGNENAVLIGESVEYAPDVELGTSKMKARPFLRPAVLNYSEEYKNIAEMYLKGK